MQRVKLIRSEQERKERVLFEVDKMCDKAIIILASYCLPVEEANYTYLK